MLIGLTGRAGSGKGEVADVLVKERGFFKLSLAAPLKRFCKDVFGWTDEQLYGPSYERNRPDARWGGLTPRHALQTLGTDWGRSMHPDVWIDYALRAVRGSRDSFVLDDVRFDNEAAAIRNAGGTVIEVFRPGTRLEGAAGQHVSEAGISQEHIGWTLINDSDLAVLKLRARRIVEVCR